MKDRRAIELEALAREEGIILPMPAETIVYHESQGRIVDLVTGQVYINVMVQPAKHAKAVAYLLQEVEEELVL